MTTSFRHRFITIFLSTGCLLGISLTRTASADEGMWPIQSVNDPVLLSASGAVVSLDFGCTGSMISDKGLLITNHHCAYSDIAAISTPGHNYLEDGFWAFRASEEIPIEGKSAYFLRGTVDVTGEMEVLRESERRAGRGYGNRRIGWLLEKKYSEQTGYEASLATMWKGERQVIYLYEVYRDLRLVAAPPVSIAAFGGDIDNWEWPQHKGDFAIYRIYTAPDGSGASYSPDNIPLKPDKILKIAGESVQDGDSTFVIGYPGRTDRYSSSWSVERGPLTEAPLMCRMQGHRLGIMAGWMESDPAVRLIYADTYFSTSNVQELYQGQAEAVRRYGVTDIRKTEEARLWEWIKSDSLRLSRWGGLKERMDSVYAATEDNAVQRVYYREAYVRSSKYYLLAMRINNMIRAQQRNEGSADTLDFSRHAALMRTALGHYREMVPEAETRMLAWSLGELTEHLHPEYWGEYLTAAVASIRNDADGYTDSVVGASFLRDSASFKAFTSRPRTYGEIMSDPLIQLFTSVSLPPSDAAEIHALEKEYTSALYNMRKEEGMRQYPDANSTMRLSRGTVGPLLPRDGVTCLSGSTMRGILEKYDPGQYEYGLKPEFRTLLEEEVRSRPADGGMRVNFLTDNDITGGNSGSPVLNSRGELTGLAFDGNKESLCSDVYFHPQYGKTVCVDISYVLWILDRYAGMDWIVEEMLRQGQ